MRVETVAVVALVVFSFGVFATCSSANDAALSLIFVDADHNGIPDIKEAQLGKLPNFEASGAAALLTALTAAAVVFLFSEDDGKVLTELNVEHNPKTELSFKLYKSARGKSGACGIADDVWLVERFLKTDGGIL